MLTEDVTHWQHLDVEHAANMRSRLLSVASGSSALENIVQLGSAVVVIFEHSFYIYDKQRYLQDQQESVRSFDVALEQYIASSHAAAVKEGVSAAVRAYEERVRTASHAHQGNLPAWTAKLPFERFQRKAKALRSQAKADFMETILELTLNHRLPRP
ncbi:uncharacterized protein EDB93DRAFT_1311390 [Suillus bovinus]|uniref:uncharacterized protein n=1 Tax=Suillus bovinus TaxID=48563 RepID=UPI001B872810|nr:uncharacterized protein EDB93DRAFT_1311390 [Suillus bovinus]KAG2131592.1 hypothetical protein EDB93DRAFT_1311390 [Suillus bovinus]